MSKMAKVNELPVPADEDWGLVLEEMEIRLGAPVAVRTTGQGVVVGRIRSAAGSMVGLLEVTQLWSWSDAGDTGSLHDLLANLDRAKIRKCMSRPKILVREVHSVDLLTEEQFDKIGSHS